MSLRYKKGDRVVMGNALSLEKANIPIKYAHETGIINCVYDNSYNIIFEDGEWWNALESHIDHEATARLNEPKYELITDDNGVYLTSRFLEPLINSTTNKEDIKKGSDKMNANEILEKWQNKRYVELRNKAEDEKQKVTKQDEIQKLFEEHETTIQKTIKEKYKVDVEVEHTFFAVTTSKTSKKLAEIEDKCKAEERELDEKINEIKAVLEVAENQDKVFEILNKQGIIDKNYNIL